MQIICMEIYKLHVPLRQKNRSRQNLNRWRQVQEAGRTFTHSADKMWLFIQNVEICIINKDAKISNNAVLGIKSQGYTFDAFFK